MSLNEASLEKAARAAISQLDMNPDDSSGTNGEARWQTELPTTQAAIESYLSAERERGWAMMPREATEAMAHRGIDVRQVQDNLARAHHAIVDTREIWREMFGALRTTEDGEPR